VPWPFVELEPLVSRPFEESLHPPVHALQENGLRTRPAAPDPPQPGGEEEEGEAQRGEEKDDQPGVLCIEGLAEEEEATVGDIQKHRRIPVDADEGEREVYEDEEGIDPSSPADEAALHIGGMDGLPGAVDFDGGEAIFARYGRGVHR